MENINTPNRLDLPASLLSPDPVEGNPFPENNPRHKVWTEATIRAEEELCRNHAFLLEKRGEGSEGKLTFLYANLVTTFDVWAKRGIQVVWGKYDLKLYEKFLVDYAEAWLRVVDDTWAAMLPGDIIINEAKNILVGRVEYWRAEARRYLAEQVADLNRQDKTPPPTSEADKAAEPRQQTTTIATTPVDCPDDVRPDDASRLDPRAPKRTGSGRTERVEITQRHGMNSRGATKDPVKVAAYLKDLKHNNAQMPKQRISKGTQEPYFKSWDEPIHEVEKLLKKKAETLILKGTIGELLECLRKEAGKKKAIRTGA